jgi:8-oxo-dGTP pyrophosphatase MutT (NUDIX family)
VKNQRDGRDQVAALPLRLTKSGRIEVLLVTSRETARWVIPKGWPMKGVKDRHAAAREALEEAGVKGDVGLMPLGAFTYFKRLDHEFRLVDVTVYPLWVRKTAGDWKEKGQRDHQWLEPAQAALLVDEPGLKAMLNALPPAQALRRLAS